MPSHAGNPQDQKEWEDSQSEREDILHEFNQVLDDLVDIREELLAKIEQLEELQLKIGELHKRAEQFIYKM